MDNREYQASRRDVEKRWGDPHDFRRAALFVGIVILVGLVVLVVFAADGGDQIILAAAVPAVFGSGGLSALVIAFLAYRRRRNWVQWHGAGWFLLALMLPALGLPLMITT